MYIFWSTLMKFQVFSAKKKSYSNRKKEKPVPLSPELQFRRTLHLEVFAFWMSAVSIPSVPYFLDLYSSCHILLNWRTVIQSNFKFIQFLTNFSVDFSLCMSEPKKDLKKVMDYKKICL